MSFARTAHHTSRVARIRNIQLRVVVEQSNDGRAATIIAWPRTAASHCASARVGVHVEELVVLFFFLVFAFFVFIIIFFVVVVVVVASIFFFVLIVVAVFVVVTLNCK